MNPTSEIEVITHQSTLSSFLTNLFTTSILPASINNISFLFFKLLNSHMLQLHYTDNTCTCIYTIYIRYMVANESECAYYFTNS